MAQTITNAAPAEKSAGAFSYAEGSDAMETAYHNVEIALDAVLDVGQKQVVPGAEDGVTVYSVALVPANFIDAPLPAGAQVRVYFGASGDEIILSSDLASFVFPCGHSGGMYYANATALAGKKVRFLLSYTPGNVVNYAS